MRSATGSLLTILVWMHEVQRTTKSIDVMASHWETVHSEYRCTRMWCSEQPCPLISMRLCTCHIASGICGRMHATRQPTLGVIRSSSPAASYKAIGTRRPESPLHGMVDKALRKAFDLLLCDASPFRILGLNISLFSTMIIFLEAKTCSPSPKSRNLSSC